MWTAIASFVVSALALVYKASEYVAYLHEARFQVSEANHKRLMEEAKIEHAETEYQGQHVRVPSIGD